MIENVVFDIGRVLLDFKPLDYLQAKFENEILTDKLYRNIFCSEEWVLLDKGTISKNTAILNMCLRDKKNEDLIRDIMENWTDILTPIESTIEILHILKSKGLKLYTLSNFHLDAFERVYEQYSFFKLFDDCIISSKIKLLKPDTDIYKYLVSSCSMDPSNVLFIDDMQINIDSAADIGLHTILYTNREDLNEGLKKLNLL